MPFLFAPKRVNVTVTSDGGITLIENGEPIRVWGMVIANNGTATDSEVYMESPDQTKFYIETIPWTQNVTEMDIAFIADSGLQLRVEGANFADINVLVFYSHLGS